MDNLSMHSTVTMAEGDREFWHGVLLAGGFTALPRWTLEPVRGVGEHEARIPDELVAALRRLADELAVSFHSVLLTAHAKVLAALSGEREVSTGYVARPGHRTDVLDAECARRNAGYYITALKWIAADPDAEHARQSLLSGEELHFQ